METIFLGRGKLTLDAYGCVAELCGIDGGTLLPEGLEPQPFIQISREKKLYGPQKMTRTGDFLHFSFETETEVTLSYTEREDYAVFTAAKVTGKADELVFGPIFTALTDEVGDIIGVVQGKNHAFGVQSLNAKTLGGFPAECMENKSPLVGEGPVSEISVDLLHYYESAAYDAVVDGRKASLVQLYCEDRRRPRVKDIMNFEAVPIEPMKDCVDAGIEGASFAMFVCGRADALDRIGQIEETEGLPHPTLDGVWAKKSRESMRSYLIAEFKPEEFDGLLDAAARAGFRNLYHAEPFEKWGHFELRRDCFPEGDKTLADYCRRAEERGMNIGVHTLSSFTTTNDEFVSPVPDERLAVLGKSRLSAALGENDTTLTAENPAVFERVTCLQTVCIGKELIRFGEVRGGALTGCERGAYGTTVSAHEKGEEIKYLLDYPYKVFFPNLELQKEYSARLGKLFAETGVKQVSFDGVEGCAAAGEDNYGINRFCLDCWDKWGQPEAVNDASRLNHNLWHMHTRMNWGEPWGAKMREGMLEYRIKNQDFFKRNLFPRMLGWFLIRKADRKFEATPPEDIEWALSMAAGFDAGFALSTSAAVLDVNGCSGEMLDLIHDWESLRLAGVFTPEQRAKLCDPKTEWHLERTENGFKLYPLSISKPMVCDLLELQPGQPGGADWVLDNPFGEQNYDIRIRVEGYGEIHNPSFMTKKGILRFPCSVSGGRYLWYRNGKACITDRNYRILEEVKPIGRGIAEPGQQAFSFSCDFSGEEGPEVTAKVFLYGKPRTIL